MIKAITTMVLAFAFINTLAAVAFRIPSLPPSPFQIWEAYRGLPEAPWSNLYGGQPDGGYLGITKPDGQAFYCYAEPGQMFLDACLGFVEAHTVTVEDDWESQWIASTR